MSSRISTQTFDSQIIDEFRANAGKVGGVFAGAPMVLITTTGAKTGNQITIPLVYLRDGERVVLIASNHGSDHNPGWYHNLRADPHLTVELGIEKFPAVASIATGAERDRLYGAMAVARPDFARYQEETEREIPVVTVYRENA
ncbi:nitroreductase family deazaflavin-dependent oxidoreductase [Nocardia callitridis]|uniref:Nitroreductase family deazaflavin-dependent oxidoreductase n=1 Tax=Nocardia callitridis TaxID=648753 RepID=A0ABP9K389_9NOCA